MTTKRITTSDSFNDAVSSSHYKPTASNDKVINE